MWAYKYTVTIISVVTYILVMEGMMNKIIAIAMGLLVVAVLVPVALVQLANATLTNVDPTVKTVLQILLPILAIIAVALLFIPRMHK